ncbi:MAG: hypothetical protein OXG34_16625 [bacterium]|nr:hypothetical protein [bacterium]
MSDTANGWPDELSADLGPPSDDAIGAGATARMMTVASPPSIEDMLIKFGGAAMVLSGLLSWVVGPFDAIPNFAGVGISTLGSGLVVFLAGLYVLLRPMGPGALLGNSIGSITVVLVFVFRFKSIDTQDQLGFGVWLALAGAIVVTIGAISIFIKSDMNESFDVDMLAVTSGAVLALVASTLFAWAFIDSAFLVDEAIIESGFDFEVITGIPVLILGTIALLCQLTLVTVSVRSNMRLFVILNLILVSGISISLLAGTHLIGGIMRGSLFSVDGWNLYSGSVAAFVGGAALVSSVRQVEATS